MAREARTDFTARDKTKGAFRSLKDSIGGLQPAMVAGLTAIGTAAAGMTQQILQTPGRVKQAFDETISSMDRLAKEAKQLDESVAQLDAMTYAAELSGATAEQMAIAYRQASKNVVDAAKGTGEGLIAFQDLGIEVKDAEGRLKTAQEIILDVADAMAKIESPTRKTAAAMKIFGESGTTLIPMLNQGAEGIREMTAEAAALGLRTEEMTAGAEEVSDAQLRWERSTRRLTDLLTVSFMPVVTDMANFLSEKLADALSDVNREFREWVQRQETAGGDEGLMSLLNQYEGLLGVLDDLRDKQQRYAKAQANSVKEQAVDAYQKKWSETGDEIAETNAQLDYLEGAINRLLDAQQKRAAAAREANQAEQDRLDALAAEVEKDLGKYADKPSPLEPFKRDAQKIAETQLPAMTEGLSQTAIEAGYAADEIRYRFSGALSQVIQGSKNAAELFKNAFLGAIADIVAEMATKLALRGIANAIVPGGGVFLEALGVLKGGPGGSGLPVVSPPVASPASGGSIVQVNFNSLAPITTADQVAAAVNLQQSQEVQSLFEVE